MKFEYMLRGGQFVDPLVEPFDVFDHEEEEEPFYHEEDEEPLLYPDPLV